MQPFKFDPSQNAQLTNEVTPEVLNSLGELLVIHEPSGKSADYYYQLGNRHYNSFLTRAMNKDLLVAINCFQKALETNPRFAEAHVKLAVALFDQGDFDADTAMDYCRHALTLKPACVEAHQMLGYFLKRQGRLDESQKHLEAAIAANPLKAARPQMALGRLLIQKASYNTTLSAAERVALTFTGMTRFTAGLALLPFDGATMAVLQHAFITDAKVYAMMALGKTCHAVGLMQLAVKSYQYATRQMPTEPIFYHLLGDMFYKSRAMETAIYYYHRAQELDPMNLALHKKLAKAYVVQNDSANAARSLEKLVEIQPDDFESMYALAQIYTDRSDFMRALYYFKDLVKKAPENPYVHSNMAYVLFKLEDYDGAIKEYKAAVEYGEDPLWTATVAQTLGTIYAQIKKDLDAAIDMYQLAQSLDESSFDCLTTLADLYLEQGNVEAAIRVYQDLVVRDPQNPDCHSYLGYLFWQADYNQKAVESYERALDCDPNNAVAFNNLGVIYLDERLDADKALTHFKKALMLNPDYTLASFNVGRAQEALGRTPDAARTYTDTLALNASSPEITDDEILERLDNLFKA